MHSTIKLICPRFVFANQRLRGPLIATFVKFGSKMPLPTVFRSVDSVLNVLEDNKDKSEGVSALLKIYDDTLNQHKNKSNKNVAKHPLIVLEGLDGCGKSTTMKNLAKKIKAIKACTPPESIKHIRHMFDDHPTLRTAYYALGNYIAGLEVDLMLKEQPVLMDRYWHSTCAYALAQAVHDDPAVAEFIPPPGDKFFAWPEDLLRPDKVIFLNVNETNRLQRLSRRTSSTTQENLLKSSKEFRDNIISYYKNFYDPKVDFIDANVGFGRTIGNIRNEIDHLF